MGASKFEQDLATARGVVIREHLQPLQIDGSKAVETITLSYTRAAGDSLEITGETVTIDADQVLKAIGQTLDCPLDLKLEGRKIVVDAEGKTSATGLWAAGDCATGGDDLTVTAVAEGRDAALSIHRFLTEG